ncbi:MAG: peptidylprolyl isomerase [Thiohalomonadaceae bacterium]
MLQFIRERAQSWIAWVIVILIIIPFALWGINQYFDGGKELPAAKVNDTEISQQRLQQVFYQQQQRLQEMLGANYRPEMFPEEQMRRQVLDGLIEQELLVQTAADSGMRIGNALLAATIHNVPAFQVDGRFSQQAYETALRSRGMEAKSFEADLRRDMLTQQFYAGIARSDFSTPAERRVMQQLLGQQRDIGFLVLPLTDFTAKVQITDAEVQAYYEAQGALFMQPEQVSIAYLELSAEQIAQGIKIGEDELRARYQSNLALYTVPEERQARHILIQVAADADAAADAAARARAENLLGQIRAGASFADVARKESQDSVSAAEGGDLGFFGRGVMDKSFEDAVFALQPGQLSEPVRSAFGYHLIKLEAVRGGTTKPFAEVREQLLAEIRNERAEQQYYEQAEQLANLTYEHPDTLEEAARQLGLTIKQSEPFTRRGGAGVLANPRLVAAAFSEDVLVRGNNSETIEVGRNHLVVLRVLQHQAEARRPLDAVREDIVTRLRRDKAATAAREAAVAVQQQLQQGGDPVLAAKAARAKWQRKDGISRDDGSVDAAIVRRAFAMPRPQEGKPSWELTTTATGDVVVLGVYAVRDGEVVEGETGAAGDLERAAGEAAFAAALTSIRSSAQISRPVRQQ